MFTAVALVLALPVLSGVVVLLLRFGYWLQHGKCYSKRRLDGKLAIVTGASSGIGLETARDLAGRGARVIMACRNLHKAQKIADAIKRTTGNPLVEVRELDTSSMASVRSFAKQILASEKVLHILVNNAGIVGTNVFRMSEDGFELTMATNHYGHFLLTNMLGDILKAGAPSRIICVSSVAHCYAKNFEVNDLNFSNRKEYTPWKAYSFSKLCNVLMARELAIRLSGTGVTSYSLHPGVVQTEILSKTIVTNGALLSILINLIGKNAQQGAQTSIFCSVDEGVANHSGRYYVDCKETPASKLGENNSLAAQVWAASAAHVKLSRDEANI